MTQGRKSGNRTRARFCVTTRSGTGPHQRKYGTEIAYQLLPFAWATRWLRMNKDETHPAGYSFFSRMLHGIRRLAALTRSPVPIEWERMDDSRESGKSRTLVRCRLNVVGRLMLVVGGWMLIVGGWFLVVGRRNCSRHARFALAGQSACSRSRLPRTSHCVRRTRTFGPVYRLSSRY